MLLRRALMIAASLMTVLAAQTVALSPEAARADSSTCALTTDSPGGSLTNPSNASPGTPCWTDVLPYPFGSDGNPVDPSSSLCAEPNATNFGPNWIADYSLSGGGTNVSTAPCYLQANSFAFRAWNRGLVATGVPGGSTGTVAFGVWLFNGTTWFPDPTFPGSNACPGSKVLWAGKLDYWLIGPSSPNPNPNAGQTLCRFDGVNLVWEPMKLPSTTIARLPVDANGQPVGGITTGACYAWNNCWFFGDAGIAVHWDGQQLTDASSGVASSPWLRGDSSAAVARTDPSGNQFGFEVTNSTGSDGNGAPVPLPAQPNGRAAPELYGSQGGAFEPLGFSSGAASPTDLLAIDSDPEGDTWVAGDTPSNTTSGSAPLLRLNETGQPVACGGYDANTFPFGSTSKYTWSSLSVQPADGSALAGSNYRQPGVTLGGGVSFNGQPDTVSTDLEPAIVLARCGQPPVLTLFRRPDPYNPDQNPADPNVHLIPADYGGGDVTGIAANADNDAWAATSKGTWSFSAFVSGDLAPHLYHFTDGQTPDAPAGDDNETRPNLFTLSPPVYVVGPPAIVTTPVTGTKKKHGRTKKVKLKPAIYDVHDKLAPAGTGTFTLYIRFRVRRAVTVGAEALQRHTVVASSGMKHFTSPSGQLVLTLNRSHWPTGLKFVTPKPKKK